MSEAAMVVARTRCPRSAGLEADPSSQAPTSSAPEVDGATDYALIARCPSQELRHRGMSKQRRGDQGGRSGDEEELGLLLELGTCWTHQCASEAGEPKSDLDEYEPVMYGLTKALGRP